MVYTTEEKKEFLRQAYRLEHLVRSHAAELTRLRATLGIAEAEGTQIDLEGQLQDEIVKMGKVWQSVHDAINAVEDKDERLVLRFRYLQGMDWDGIAAELSYSVRQVQRIHGDALEHFVVPKS